MWTKSSGLGTSNLMLTRHPSGNVKSAGQGRVRGRKYTYGNGQYLDGI